MENKLEIFKRVWPSLGPIILRNIFLLTNGVIFLVVVLLFIFGSLQASLFLGVIFFLNTLIAIIQDVQARVLLEKLQLLTALRILRLNPDQTETLILAEEIVKGDLLKLKLGDQAPCEGKIISADNLEISEALITGESDSFSKLAGDQIIAGAIVTSGQGVMEALGLFSESRLALIAGDVKKYAASPSSIQRAVNKVMAYAGYLLVASLLFVIARGLLWHLPKLTLIMNAGALASMIVPQGLIVVVTLLFAVGAAKYSRRDVLFQEINATEKLGRIKNLCFDKTGTLTDNVLVVAQAHIFPGAWAKASLALTYAGVLGLDDSSQILLAVKKYLEEDSKLVKPQKKYLRSLPFSSWRRYGAVEIEGDQGQQTIFIGTPDIFLPSISKEEEKKWLTEIVEENTLAGKRVLCVAGAVKAGLPKGLADATLSILAIFVFHNTLRPGVKEAVKFLQARGLRLRVLSGDNANTARAVSQSAGVNRADQVITGAELAKWTAADFDQRAHDYTVFAQILPEHKVKLIEAFKKDGFTAMVGDGVNDALAMKKADLGIAMFDGVPVTRQLAGVILMTNSFADLPGAVELADHFIRSIEINAGIYINQSLIGFFFFVMISLFGFSYPITPLNVTFINYFTVGLPGLLIAYWALRPINKIPPANSQPFLKRVLPLVMACAVVEAIGAAIIFALSPDYLKTAASNILVLFSFIIFGFFFLFFAVRVYGGFITKKEILQFSLLGLLELVIIYSLLQIPFLIKFFNITLPYPELNFIIRALLVVLVGGIAQYFIVKKFFFNKN